MPSRWLVQAFWPAGPKPRLLVYHSRFLCGSASVELPLVKPNDEMPSCQGKGQTDPGCRKPDDQLSKGVGKGFERRCDITHEIPSLLPQPELEQIVIEVMSPPAGARETPRDRLAPGTLAPERQDQCKAARLGNIHVPLHAHTSRRRALHARGQRAASLNISQT